MEPFLILLTTYNFVPVEVRQSDLFHFRDEKEKEREGNGHETDALSKYNDWTKATYTDYLARSDYTVIATKFNASGIKLSTFFRIHSFFVHTSHCKNDLIILIVT